MPVKVFEKNTTCVFVKNRRRTFVRWRFFSKPLGLDLERCCVAGGGNNLVLLSFLFFSY